MAAKPGSFTKQRSVSLFSGQSGLILICFLWLLPTLGSLSHRSAFRRYLSLWLVDGISSS